MRITVLYDKSGNIIAASIPSSQTLDYQGTTSSMKAEKDQYISELEVPEKSSRLGLAHMFEDLKVEVKGEQHKLVSKSQ